MSPAETRGCRKRRFTSARSARDATKHRIVDVAEREALREAVGELLRDRSTEQDVRRVIASAEGFDRGLWRQLAEQGLTGIIIDDRLVTSRTRIGVGTQPAGVRGELGETVSRLVSALAQAREARPPV